MQNIIRYMLNLSDARKCPFKSNCFDMKVLLWVSFPFLRFEVTVFASLRSGVTSQNTLRHLLSVFLLRRDGEVNRKGLKGHFMTLNECNSGHLCGSGRGVFTAYIIHVGFFYRGSFNDIGGKTEDGTNPKQ